MGWGKLIRDRKKDIDDIADGKEPTRVITTTDGKSPKDKVQKYKHGGPVKRRCRASRS